MPDVAANQPHAPGQSSAADPLPRARQHRLRSIDANKRDAGTAERNRDAPGAAAKLQDRTRGVPRKVAPEGHVAPPERTRVLPIVERRVFIPTFISFGHDLLGSWALEVGS